MQNDPFTGNKHQSPIVPDKAALKHVLEHPQQSVPTMQSVFVLLARDGRAWCPRPSNDPGLLPDKPKGMVSETHFLAAERRGTLSRAKFTLVLGICLQCSPD